MSEEWHRRKESVMLEIMPLRMRREIRDGNYLDDVREIRVRMGRRIHFIGRGEEKVLHLSGGASEITKEDIREMSGYLMGYSMYAYEEELRQGFLTLKGGNRVGICGEVVLEEGRVTHIKNISSFNIRVSHEVFGCATRMMKYSSGNLLLISPPGRGKTTLLRDLLRQLADLPQENVGIVDERSEIAGSYLGEAQNHLGERVDILDGCPKAEGMLLLLRTMSPTVIGVDELGKRDDVEALLRVTGCGVRVIATIHGEGLPELRKKEVLRPLFEQKIFLYYASIEEEWIRIYNREEEEVEAIPW